MNTTSKIIRETSRRGISRFRSLHSGLPVFLACFFLQGRATACGVFSEVKSMHPGRESKAAVSYVQSDKPSSALDYYQSSDNPLHAD